MFYLILSWISVTNFQLLPSYKFTFFIDMLHYNWPLFIHFSRIFSTGWDKQVIMYDAETGHTLVSDYFHADVFIFIIWGAPTLYVLQLSESMLALEK